MASADFVIDFSKRMKNVGAAVVDVEFTTDDTRLCRIRIGTDCNDSVRDASQEEVASLASDIGSGHDKLPRQFLLHGKVVLVDAFRNLVIRGVGARSE